MRTAPKREYGHAEVAIEDTSTALFAGMPSAIQVWMSHGDEALELLLLGFSRTGGDDQMPWLELPMRNDASGPCRFHPEVHHTPLGPQLIKNFIFKICGAAGDWTPAHFIETTVAGIREPKVGDGHVICGLSGGVDSSVAAVLVHKAIGSQLTCIFASTTGCFARMSFKSVQKNLRDKLGLNIVAVDASDRFLAKLEGVTDPETKRKRIGAEFIAVFDDEATRIAKQTRRCGLAGPGHALSGCD